MHGHNTNSRPYRYVVAEPACSVCKSGSHLDLCLSHLGNRFCSESHRRVGVRRDRDTDRAQRTNKVRSMLRNASALGKVPQEQACKSILGFVVVLAELDGHGQINDCGRLKSQR